MRAIQDHDKKKRRGITGIIVGAIILILLMGSFVSQLNLNLSGVCQEEGRLLSEKEIIQRFLLEKPWEIRSSQEHAEIKKAINSLSEGEKQAQMQKLWAQYFGCCRVFSDKIAVSGRNQVYDRLFSGKYFYKIQAHFPDDDDGYSDTYIEVDSCGRSYARIPNIYQTKIEYEKSIAENKEYWRKKERDNE